jgi:hypothetical protein
MLTASARHGSITRRFNEGQNTTHRHRCILISHPARVRTPRTERTKNPRRPAPHQGVQPAEIGRTRSTPAGMSAPSCGIGGNHRKCPPSLESTLEGQAHRIKSSDHPHAPVCQTRRPAHLHARITRLGLWPLTPGTDKTPVVTATFRRHLRDAPNLRPKDQTTETAGFSNARSLTASSSDIRLPQRGGMGSTTKPANTITTNK